MIHQACLRGDWEALKDIMNSQPATINLLDSNGII